MAPSKAGGPSAAASTSASASAPRSSIDSSDVSGSDTSSVGSPDRDDEAAYQSAQQSMERGGDGDEKGDEANPSERQGLVARSPEDDDDDGETARPESALTVRQAARVYRSAIFWCLVTSACVIMEGYDMILIGNFYAYPTFAAKYGQFVDAHGQHQLSAAWQAALGNSAPVGCFVGTWLNGWLVARYGQRRVLLGALAALAGTVFLTFFAPNIAVLMVGELLCGVPWGIFASSAPAYASELLPGCLADYLTSWTNMCFILGQLIAAGVLAALIDRDDDWAYRIPFALQWLWPVIIFPVLCFAPESPWHLVRQGRRGEALAALRRLQNPRAAAQLRARVSRATDPETTLATIERTNALELKTAGTASTRYAACFRGIERRRTEIACISFAAQVLAGAPFAYNSTYFFQQVGLSTRQTYLLNTGGTLLALAGTVVNWVALMPRYGRRRIFLWGLLVMASLLFVIGLLSPWAGASGPGSRAAWVIGLTQAMLTLAWTFVFQLSVGQLGWALPAKIGATRLRQKTVCLARNAYYAASITANITQPYLINPGALDWKGYVGFFWGASCFLVFVWAFFRLPETRDRSYEELDWLFAARTPTRKFAATRMPRGRDSGVALPDEGDYGGRGNEDEDEDATEMVRLVRGA